MLQRAGAEEGAASRRRMVPWGMYVPPKHEISLNRLLLGAFVQGAVFVLIASARAAGDYRELAAQAFAAFSVAFVVLYGVVPSLDVFSGSAVVFMSCLAYCVAYFVGMNIIRDVPDALAWGLSSFIGATILAFAAHGMLFEKADFPMTLVVGVTPVASVALLPLFDIGRIWWTLYHAVWCWLFLAGFAFACRLRGRITPREPH